MENGSFQANLEGVDFETDEFSYSVPTPVTAPLSTSIDSLLRQNEDLSARLKVTTQRLIQFETSLQEELETNQKLMKMQSNHNDQILIWKEKEKLWLEKLEVTQQKVSELEQRFPKYQQLLSDVTRYRKYHEKVKTQIKPYIQQLKDYSKGLVNEVRELHRELGNQDVEINKKSQRIDELTQELNLQMRAQEASMTEMKAGYESEIKSLGILISNLKESHIILENKAARMDQAMARQDELDNLLIEYRRKLDEAEIRISNESEGLRQSLQMARNDLTKKNLMLESMTEKEAKIQNENQRMQLEIQNLNEQMASLRFLWTEKSNENENLKSSLQALEKINQELSQKMQAIRQS